LFQYAEKNELAGLVIKSDANVLTPDRRLQWWYLCLDQIISWPDEHTFIRNIKARRIKPLYTWSSNSDW